MHVKITLKLNLNSNNYANYNIKFLTFFYFYLYWSDQEVGYILNGIKKIVQRLIDEIYFSSVLFFILLVNKFTKKTDFDVNFDVVKIPKFD